MSTQLYQHNVENEVIDFIYFFAISKSVYYFEEVDTSILVPCTQKGKNGD